jgi:hypothetical protein
MEENFGHFFDSVIPFDSVEYVYEQLLYEINLLEREPQWVPAKWVKEKKMAAAAAAAAAAVAAAAAAGGANNV